MAAPDPEPQTAAPLSAEEVATLKAQSTSTTATIVVAREDWHRLIATAEREARSGLDAGLRDDAGRSPEWYDGYNAAMRDYDKRRPLASSGEAAPTTHIHDDEQVACLPPHGAAASSRCPRCGGYYIHCEDPYHVAEAAPVDGLRCWDTDGDHAPDCRCRQGGEVVHRLDAREEADDGRS